MSETAWRTLGRAAGAVVVGLALSGCELSQSCTEIGCFDAATIRVFRADGATPPFAVRLDIDGKLVACGAPDIGGTRQGTCDDPSVTLSHQGLADCVETRSGNAFSQSCTPNGRFELLIRVQGTPQRVAVNLETADDQTGSEPLGRTFELQYTASQPNGPDCEPTCLGATAEWELPNQSP